MHLSSRSVGTPPTESIRRAAMAAALHTAGARPAHRRAGRLRPHRRGRTLHVPRPRRRRPHRRGVRARPDESRGVGAGGGRSHHGRAIGGRADAVPAGARSSGRRRGSAGGGRPRRSDARGPHGRAQSAHRDAAHRRRRTVRARRASGARAPLRRPRARGDAPGLPARPRIRPPPSGGSSTLRASAPSFGFAERRSERLFAQLEPSGEDRRHSRPVCGRREMWAASGCSDAKRARFEQSSPSRVC